MSYNFYKRFGGLKIPVLGVFTYEHIHAIFGKIVSSVDRISKSRSYPMPKALSSNFDFSIVYRLSACITVISFGDVLINVSRIIPK